MSFCDHCEGQRFDRAQVLRVLRETQRSLRRSAGSKVAAQAIAVAIDSIRRLEIPHLEPEEDDVAGVPRYPDLSDRPRRTPEQEEVERRLREAEARARLLAGRPWPPGLAAVVLQSADRPILQKLAPDEVVGMYQACSKLAFPMLLLVTVPKHRGKPTGNDSPVGYFFEEEQLRSLVDEKRFRERIFWVNKETGLSDSWDLQLGRMYYAPNAYSPRHVHTRSKTGTVTPEHFYFIEKGTGEVKHDTGTLPIGPGSLVLIPAGEWHQLVASETGFDYIEFQAPFDFATTMDHDPLGKNWYIKGTDDGTGKPKLWVQS